MRALWPALAALILLSACASAPRERPQPPRPRPPPVRPVPPPPAELMRLDQLPGWREEDHRAAFDAFVQGCGVDRSPEMARACDLARRLERPSDETARVFLESRFRAQRVGGEGLLTAYFSPEYQARFSSNEEFSAPVRPRPADLEMVDPALIGASGSAKVAAVRTSRGYEPYPARAEIEAREETQPLAWMRPEDLFFLQIQGSGVLVLPDGRRLRAVVAATNGLTFLGIARPMREEGLLADNNTSGDAIRRWLAEHRGPEADRIMRMNPRYVFFRMQDDDGREPSGAANVPLPTGRGIAVDPAWHRYGEAFWIDADAPALSGAFPRYRRFVMALDTGGAIKGQVRADLYIGRGDAAGVEAGRVRHNLRMWRLVPVGPDGR